jgi:site-specific recombinase XerD
MTGKNIWRLCKTYFRIIGYSLLKPHDLRHGVAMEILEQHHDLEAVRAMLGHTRIDTTRTYAQTAQRSSSRPSSSTKRRRRIYSATEEKTRLRV